MPYYRIVLYNNMYSDRLEDTLEFLDESSASEYAEEWATTIVSWHITEVENPDETDEAD